MPSIGDRLQDARSRLFVGRDAALLAAGRPLGVVLGREATVPLAREG